MATLFTPITINGIICRNRLVLPPMVLAVLGDFADKVDPEGHVTPTHLEHYGVRADAGTGMIIVEAAVVAESGRMWRGGLHAYDDEYLPGLMQLATRIRQGGAVAAIQLVHGGQGSPTEITGHVPLGPSTVTDAQDGGCRVRGVTAEELVQVQDAFVDAAVRAIHAGFDAVEIHGAHGFLLDSFLSPVRNRRTDAYGGDMAGRMRMLTEVCTRVRTAIGGKVLICRISPFTHRDEGFTQDDLRVMIKGLETAGVDIIDVSTDGALRDEFAPGLTIGQEVKALTDRPVIIAGGIRTPEEADRVIAEHHADFIAVGTGMLQNPQWAKAARAQLGT